MADGVIYDPTSTVGTVRRLIADRAEPYHFSDAEIGAFLDEADDCQYGAAGLALLAWIAEEVRGYAQVSAGNVSRVQHNISYMENMAKRYIEMSNTVSLDAAGDAGFATARIDWDRHMGTQKTRRRIYAETMED